MSVAVLRHISYIRELGTAEPTPTRRRARARRRLWWAAGFILLAGVPLGWTTVSYAPAIDVRFCDAQGRPLANVWVAYRYRGSRFNLVDSLSYERRGALVQSAGDGSLRVSGFVHVHAPFDGGLKPVLEWVFSPDVHNLSRPWSLEPRKVAEHFEILTDPLRIVLWNRADLPELWLQSLMELRSQSSRRSVAQETRYDVSDEQRDRLQRQFEQELDAFLVVHGRTPRGDGHFGDDALRLFRRERAATGRPVTR